MAKIKNQTIVVIGGKEPVLQEKSVEITENTTTTYTADEGFDGLKSLEVTTNVASSGGGDDTELKKQFLEKTLTGEFVIPANVSNIGLYALYDQYHVTKLVIPNTITDLQSYCFGYMTGLREVIYDGKIPYSGLTNTNCVFYKAGAENSDFIIGENTTIIPYYLLSPNSPGYEPNFVRIYNKPRNKNLTISTYQTYAKSGHANRKLKKIWLDNFGTGTLKIEQRAFRNAQALEKIYINAPIIKTDANEYVFADTTGVIVKLGNAVTSIDHYIFNIGRLVNVYVGNNIKSMGVYALSHTASYNLLKAITVDCAIPPTIYTSTFTTSEIPIYIPKGSLEAYQSATNWSALASRLVELEYTNYTDGTNTLTLGNNLWFDMTIGGVAYNGTYTLTDGALSLEVFDKDLDATYTGTLADGVATITVNGVTYTLTLEA